MNQYIISINWFNYIYRSINLVAIEFIPSSSGEFKTNCPHKKQQIVQNSNITSCRIIKFYGASH